MISRSARSGRVALSTATGTAALLALSACVPNTATTAGATSIAVESTATTCVVSKSTAPSGTVEFTVTNSADKATEFYLLAADGKRIVGEVENVAPGAPRKLTVKLEPGKYFTSCKPGMNGAGVGTARFTVTSSSAGAQRTGDEKTRAQAAAAEYVSYVRDQVSRLVPATTAFLDAYRAGDDATARSLYASTRAYYERIEPVAESFGDLDPEIDLREADVAEGDTWTGWHRIEKDLWPPAAANDGRPYAALTTGERATFSAKLEKDTARLWSAVNASGYGLTADAISNGAIGLLDEVANGKITGEEEIWSHTDLSDFQANLEGARVAYEGVRTIVVAKNASLATRIDGQFDSLEKQLAAYGSLSTGFTPYDELTKSQVKSLADGVNALSEPLSRLTSVVVG
ncbi:iron uptake system protein EfeO [Lacisediminihabitans profunda]|uniref:PbrT family lead (Pb2+) uptake porter n=1 Tax=Lacisediminihabitans profunda TaxID=2594790 RepID=A0A5C8URJ0_9MICO|nr:iron uptake system protein EfeO [Lacisediminihabitans profunda]TXN31201.1 PbrT family lead (Pb2+) uptake porter [Lacisediminihabitans profunda]